MRRHSFILLPALLALIACEPAGPQDAPAGKGPATGFMTASSPAAAEASRAGEIPTDSDGRPYGYGLLGEPLPDFSGPLAGGGEFSSEDLDGWTLIDVWGIWCSDCLSDAPYVAALSRAVAQDPGLDFVSIHTPPSAARADEAFGRYGSVEAYFAEKGYSYPTVIDADASLRDKLRISWTPSYLLVSPAGTVEAFRTDLSAAGEAPVKALLKDISGVRAAWSSAPLDTGALRIGPRGAGRLRGPTEFTLAAAQGAFPGFEIVSDTDMTEGETYPVFHVRNEAGETLFTLEPDWSRGTVSALITRHPGIAGPDGERVGDARLVDMNAIGPADCIPGREELAGHLVCHRGSFAWIFELPDNYAGPTDAAPASVTGSARLSQMRYIPSREPD